jgi:hypothetical protein
VTVKVKRKRHVRPRDQRIFICTSENAPQGFPVGSACLRVREPLTKEKAEAITTSTPLQLLLQREAFGIPNKLTAAVTIKNDTQRAHLYVLHDALLEIPNGGPNQGGIDACMIGALERIALQRKWVPTTLSSTAQSLFGAMLRLDQYTGSMKPIDLLTSGSYWKDANKAWVRMICGHTPIVGEVTPADMTSMLKKRGVRLSTHALLACCWHTSGRPNNWLYVKKADVRVTAEDEATKKAAAEKKGEAMGPLGFRMSVTWRDHKTIGTRQSFTTHSWMNKETGAKVKRWMDEANNPSDWMFPKIFWESMKQEIAVMLKEITPEGVPCYDLRALRRGCLSTMARAGVPLDDLVLFSLHTGPNNGKNMLVRYLSAGLHARELAERGEKAAQHLLNPNEFQQYPSSNEGV